MKASDHPYWIILTDTVGLAGVVLGFCGVAFAWGCVLVVLL